MPRGNQLLEETQLDGVVTDGFDLLDWEYSQEDHSQGKKRRKSRLHDLYKEPEEPNEPDPMYDRESKTHMNGETSLKQQPIDDVADGKIKKLTKREQRRLKAALKSRQKTKGKSKNDISDYDRPSDPVKVKILNRIYSEIMTLSKHLKNDEKLVQFFDVSIYKEDLDNLKDDEWLNDNNISFVYEYLERYLLHKYPKLVSDSIFLVRPSMVYLLANFPNPPELKGVLPPLESPTARFIILPINDNDDVEAVESGSHWSLVVISLLDKTAYIYDTLERSNEKEAKEVIDKVSKYLNNGTKFNIRIIENTPQQINGSDCGIMVSQLTGFLLSRLLDLDHLKEHYMDFKMDNISISAVDGRIFVLGSILNVLKHKLLSDNEL